MPATVRGRPGDRRPIQPMTALGVALVAILICVDAAIWFTRAEDDAAASPERQRADASQRKAPQAPGSHVRSKVKPGERLVTDHYLVPEDPVRSVVLSVREATGYADMEAAVSRLELSADGRSVDVDDPKLRGATSQTITLRKPASTIELRYVTRGVVIPSVPSTAGRALTLANPLVADVEAPAGEAVVELGGTKVLSMACSPGRRLAEPCGRSDKNGGWRVKLSGRDADSAVVAQVNTPSG